MANGYEEQARAERDRAQRKTITETLNLVREVKQEIVELRKDIRLVREDLRNVDNLRALRPQKDEEIAADTTSEKLAGKAKK